ncbi:hypothetical protein [Kitasatospora sp. NPDC093806]|uniref:hypothetical protein n=1 Tax=Kitasatospora sp. NPDC093806 TaxID=3155075 RepID=UPI003435BC98
MTEREFIGWDGAASGPHRDDEQHEEHEEHDRRADQEVEHELRILLQLAAPHLPAPEDRMEQVRARAARTRRRRRAAALAAGLTAGLTAAVLAAAPALAPGPSGIAIGPASAGAVPGGASPASPSAGASPSATPSRAPDGAAGSGTDASEGGWPVRFAQLEGLVVDSPPEWYRLVVPAGAERSESVGYLSSQPLVAQPGCPIRNGERGWYCLSTGALADDGAVVALRVFPGSKAAAKDLGAPQPVSEIPLDKECNALGGTRALRGYRALPVNGQLDVVELTACLRLPSTGTVLLVGTVLDSVRSTGGASEAPTVTPE